MADWARRSLTRSRNLATPYSAPNGPLEECIAEVWRAVLQLDRVGRDDLFFDLGGTSFSVVQAVSILEAEHGLSFSIVDCFENPTVAALAASKDAGGAEASAEDAKARGEARRGKRRRRRRDREET